MAGSRKRRRANEVLNLRERDSKKLKAETSLSSDSAGSNSNQFLDYHALCRREKQLE